MNFKTEQEAFWAGEFGTVYADRNQVEFTLPAKIAFFSEILAKTRGISSVIEFGANAGTNMTALKQLLPTADLSAIEINRYAAEKLKSIDKLNVYNLSILDFEPKILQDLVLIKGVLIHINPDELQRVYEKLYATSKKYICIAEYYNPTPVTVTYRGHTDKLFKRDFAGELMDKYPDLKLIDYGFVYHRDNNFPQDDINWFLFEK